MSEKKVAPYEPGKLETVEQEWDRYAEAVYGLRWRETVGGEQLAQIRQAFVSGFYANLMSFIAIANRDDIAEEKAVGYLVGARADCERIIKEMIEEQAAKSGGGVH